MTAFTIYNLTMTAIINGLCDNCCPCTSMMITTTYKEGSGDTGITTTAPGTKGDKSDELVALLWGQLSKLQPTLKKVTPYFMDDDAKVFLHWVWENIRSMSSLAYVEGATDRHAFPPIAIAYMDMVIGLRKDEMGGSPSFIQWEHEHLLEMELLWAEVRATELLYRAWTAQADINEAVEDRVRTVLTLVNRLSSYLWWSMRTENKVRGMRELVWQGYVTEFPFSM